MKTIIDFLYRRSSLKGSVVSQGAVSKAYLRKKKRPVQPFASEMLHMRVRQHRETDSSERKNNFCETHLTSSLTGKRNRIRITAPGRAKERHNRADMFRNQYDNDVTVWSPQGRIHQIEYAMEAVKQGSATVGLKSKTHAVLVALKRAQSELAAHQKKILHVDNHIGISIAGLTADARLLCNFMRQECLDSRFVFDRPLPASRLVTLVGSKTQIPTQRYGRRPYGVGLLIAGFDDMGPHIFQTCPSANYFDCKAMSIGARSQSARTYLERCMDKFSDCNLNDLVQHGLRALRETLPAEQDLTTKNVSIGIVGKETEFTIYDDDDVASFLEGLEERPQRKVAPPADEPAAEVPDEPMEH
ncbi:putative proteasome subunit alpha type-1-like isoform 6 [Scophthalmus maximus]|uniref:Proteasome subunit alpha type-1 n=1 Tax=Scophthalmus maximus TaxID=52904 RepID=A0A2U9BUH5_SCOMX|nr:putative proteasome subunit alpha type-1-like isoform 5 [Scophthalmus maximus]AWP07844.1 putative proteasome subunit alpha type-1-like isoform 6 [Scophthalmus maximus]